MNSLEVRCIILQVRLVLLLVDPLLEDHGGQTLIHELAKRGCLQVHCLFPLSRCIIYSLSVIRS